jgi:hypothetical protein
LNRIRNSSFVKNFLIKGTIIGTIAILISVILLFISMPLFPIEISILLFCIPIIPLIVFNFKALTIPQYVEISKNELYLYSNYQRARIKRNEVEHYFFKNKMMKVVYKRNGRTYTYMRKNIDEKIDDAIRKEFL